MIGTTQASDVSDKQTASKELGESAAAPDAVNTALPAPAPVPSPDQVEEEVARYAELSTRWGACDLIDIGPAASVTATPQGAVFVTRTDQIVIAKRAGATGFTPIDLPAEDFVKYGWGPSVSSSHAYWTSRNGHLMRASLRDLKSESLFDHARASTRTSVQTQMKRDVVAFIAQIEDRSFAHIWASPGTNGPELIDASADGHQATSVALVQGDPHPRLVVLEGRTSMSPVHSRVVRVTPRRVLLEPNEIVWIGPGSHDLTEIHAIGTAEGEAVVFLPTQRDFHAFGLAQLRIDPAGGESEEPGWQVFPNGLDPAPLSTGHFCGADHIIFARPSEQRPRSPQELHIARLSGNTPQAGEVLVRSRAFNDVSVAPVRGGAILVWTADKRTWGMVLRCPGSKD